MNDKLQQNEFDRIPLQVENDQICIVANIALRGLSLSADTGKSLDREKNDTQIPCYTEMELNKDICKAD